LLLNSTSDAVDEFANSNPLNIEKLHHNPVEDRLIDTKHQSLPAVMGVFPGGYGVFDLETQRSAEEVGGWNRAEKMGISVAVVYDSRLDGCVTYLEHEIPSLISHLQELELVVGFNIKRFDYRVLAGYSPFNMDLRPTLDLLEQVNDQLGYRLSLNRLAEKTLGAQKTADGLQALTWYKEGRIDLIQKYCRKDVEITRDLLHFGLENGYFLFQNKAGKLVRLPLDLKASITTALRRSR
jgi:DEAD/DEAH box helicase domain-containing protein